MFITRNSITSEKIKKRVEKNNSAHKKKREVQLKKCIYCHKKTTFTWKPLWKNHQNKDALKKFWKSKLYLAIKMQRLLIKSSKEITQQ